MYTGESKIVTIKYLYEIEKYYSERMVVVI